jgi:hypothetical protein
LTPVLELVEVEGLMPNATNLTLLARSQEGRLWVYKPEQGETPLWDFPAGSLALREVLTFETAEAMGLELVPETVLSHGPQGPGSAQALIDEDVDFDPRSLLLPSIDPAVWPVAVLDLVCNNADRKLGHLIRPQDSDHLWAIDHGLTFHRHPKLRTVLWGLAGEPIPDDLLQRLARLRQALEDGLRERVASLLSAAEAEALQQRVDQLLAVPRHPFPPEDRPALPWPLW